MSGTGTQLIQDVFSGIHITIMHTTTPRTNPVPYSKTCDTFRPRIGHGAAIGAGLGRKRFVHFFKPRAMLNSLVRQLSSEGRPASIKNGLRHTGLGKSGGIHVAYRNVIKLTHDAGAEFVVKIVPAIGNLRVNRLHPFLFIRPLRHGQSLLSASVNVLRLNLFASGQGGEVFQSKVNPDTSHGRTGIGRNDIDINHDVQEPVAPAIAGKVRSVLDFALGQGAAVEHAKGVASKAKGVPLALEFAPLERHPAQRPLAPVAQERAFLLAARLGVLLAHGVHGARVQAQLFTAASSELVQIKPGMPATAKAQGIFLPVVTEVPDEVHRPALLVQQAAQRLHPVSVDKDHFCRFRYSASARRTCSDTERSVFCASSRSAANSGSGRKKFARIMRTSYAKNTYDTFGVALYLPGMNAEVSREF